MPVAGGRDRHHRLREQDERDADRCQQAGPPLPVELEIPERREAVQPNAHRGRDHERTVQPLGQKAVVERRNRREGGGRPERQDCEHGAAQQALPPHDGRGGRR
jgi:hypothetical protein